MENSKFLAHSVQNPSDDEDDIGEAEDVAEHMKELRDDMKEAFGGLDISDEAYEYSDDERAGGDDFRQVEAHHFNDDSVNGEIFGARLDLQRANGKKTTSTPIVSNAVPVRQRIQTFPASPWLKSPTGRGTSDRPGLFPERVQRNLDFGVGDTLDQARRNNNELFLKQDYITPQKITEEQKLKLVLREKETEFDLVRREMDANCAALEGELGGYRATIDNINQEKEHLQNELNRLNIALGERQADASRYEKLWSEAQNNLRRMQHEKDDLLKNLHTGHGQIEQLKSEINQMTSWETVDNLKTEKERCINELTVFYQKEVKELKEAHAKELATRTEWLNKAKEDAESLRSTLQDNKYNQHNLEDSVRNAKKEIDALKQELKDLSKSPNKEQHTVNFLNGQIKTKDEEIERLKKISRDLEEASRTQSARHSDTVTRLRDDLSRQEQENARLVNEQAKLKEECVNLKNDLIKATDDVHAARAEKSRILEDKVTDERTLRGEIELLKTSLEKLEIAAKGSDQQKSELATTVASLKEQLSKSTVDIRRRSMELLRLQLATKERELKDLTEKLHEVEDRLHSQLKTASDDNRKLQDEKNHLLAEAYTMKKVLKKMKTLVSPSPNTTHGHMNSSTYQEINMENMQSSRMHAMGVGGDQTSDERKYVRELIIQRGDTKTELERKYQQQLVIDRQKIVKQIDAVYTKKLQQVLNRLHLAPAADFSELNTELF